MQVYVTLECEDRLSFIMSDIHITRGLVSYDQYMNWKIKKGESCNDNRFHPNNKMQKYTVINVIEDPVEIQSMIGRFGTRFVIGDDLIDLFNTEFAKLA